MLASFEWITCTGEHVLGIQAITPYLEDSTTGPYGGTGKVFSGRPAAPPCVQDEADPDKASYIREDGASVPCRSCANIVDCEPGWMDLGKWVLFIVGGLALCCLCLCVVLSCKNRCTSRSTGEETATTDENAKANHP